MSHKALVLHPFERQLVCVWTSRDQMTSQTAKCHLASVPELGDQVQTQESALEAQEKRMYFFANCL